MPKLFLVSLGCPKNTVDSEVMLGYLTKSCNYTLTEDPFESDTILINTCGFITPAKEESIDEILNAIEIKKQKPDVRIIVAGCLYERYKAQLRKQLPEVDAFLGVYELENVVKHVGCGVITQDKPYKLRQTITPPHIGYLKIADGCSNVCSFCAIPLIKGGFKNRPIDELIDEAGLLSERGVRELYVIAQDTTAYGKGPGDLVRLLEKLNKIEKLKWIRVMYTYPSRVTDELIDAILNLEKVVNYIDVPFQHVDDDVLKSMRRRYSGRDVIKLTEKLKKANITIRSTFIVGFPKETKKAFERLCSFIREYELQWVGFFPYYREEGTKAYSLGDTNKKLKLKRLEKLKALQDEIMQNRLKNLQGSIIQIMVDGESDELEGYMEARSPESAYEIDGKIFFKPKKHHNPGEIIKIKLLNSINPADLVGKELF